MHTMNNIALTIGWVVIAFVVLFTARLIQIVLLGIFWERAVDGIKYEWRRFCQSRIVTTIRATISRKTASRPITQQELKGR
jgi:hypothetical protein